MRARGMWLLVGLVGCESSYNQVGPPPVDPDTGTDAADSFACDNRTFDGSCIQFTGSAWDRITGQSSCDGSIIEGRCPTPNLGGCIRDLGLPLEYVDVYYEGEFYESDGAEFLRADCELNSGEWRT